MENIELICIGCPLGCNLNVTIDNGSVCKVDGNTCKRGSEYAVNECTNPLRMLTTTVAVENGQLPVVSVKTSSGIPKGRIFECISNLKTIKANAPIHIGDVIVYNICNTGCDIIATTEII